MCGFEINSDIAHTHMFIRLCICRDFAGSSKAALDMMTRCLAAELGPHGIRINNINPTVVLTEMGRRVNRRKTGREGILHDCMNLGTYMS